MKKVILILTLCAAFLKLAEAQHEISKQSAAFDNVMKEQFPFHETGAVALVSRQGKIIYKAAAGKADIELDVPMQTDHVFEIGSITKQFTAVAILQLMEQGKLKLEDAITRFIPDYPMGDERITIEHLLTHTSGISDFVSIADTLQHGRLDITPQQMIHAFQNVPKRFSPGVRYEYSNSNYFLLGYIIEAITGKTYGQYLEDHIFRPLDMTHSFYGSDRAIFKKRASGYSMPEKEIQNAAFLSMSQPYAAGAILSTIEDLFKWQQALHSNKLVKKETLDKAWSRYRLNDGKNSDYGYGWRLGFIQESQSVWHGGLISGFMSMAMYLPQEDVYAVVLSNCDCNSPEFVAAKLAAIAIGKPYEYKEITLADSVLQSYAGIYENGMGDQRIISVSEGKLYSQRIRNPKVAVKAFRQDHFVFDDPTVTMVFGKNENGQVENLTIKSRSGNEIWNKSDKPIQTLTEIKVEEKILETYTGEYEVTPQFTFIISREQDRLFLEATGQEKLEIFAEDTNKFFLKVNDAQLEFVSESGKVTKAILKQNGRMTEAKKIE